MAEEKSLLLMEDISQIKRLWQCADTKYATEFTGTRYRNDVGALIKYIDNLEPVLKEAQEEIERLRALLRDNPSDFKEV